MRFVAHRCGARGVAITQPLASAACASAWRYSSRGRIATASFRCRRAPGAVARPEQTEAEAEVGVVVDRVDLHGARELRACRGEAPAPEVGAGERLADRGLVGLEVAGRARGRPRPRAGALPRGGGCPPGSPHRPGSGPSGGRSSFICFAGSGTASSRPVSVGLGRVLHGRRPPSEGLVARNRMRQSGAPRRKRNPPVPEFLPFRGLRYQVAADGDGGDLTAVAAPPYDVVDDEERDALEAADPHNSVRLILPRGPSRVTSTSTRPRPDVSPSWRAAGVLVADAEPALLRVPHDLRHRGRLAPADDRGPRGACAPAPGRDPADAGILPHERTLPKARSDRLALLRATRANLDPIWGLSLASGLTNLVPVAGDPLGVGDRRPRRDPRALARRRRRGDRTIAASVAARRPWCWPTVTTASRRRRNYQAERQAERPDGSDDAGAAAIMTLVVELADDQLCVRRDPPARPRRAARPP